MEDLERVQARLDNIRAVEPILGALRTISLGSWQAARKQREVVQRYGERLVAMLPPLLPHLPAKRRASREIGRRFARIFADQIRARRWGRRSADVGEGTSTEAAPARVVALVVGSERGLCGRFNAALVEHVEGYLAERARAGAKVELMALGTRLCRIFQSQGRPLAWSGRLPATALPPSPLAFDLTRRWLARYEARELDAVDLLYNAYHGAGRYQPTTVRLVPPRLPAGMALRSRGPLGEPWPPPIIETDPFSLYAQVIEQWAAVSLYGWLLESAASEHSTRYQLMEAATQNAERLIEELTMVVQATRRQAITREMQELAAGAGLISPHRYSAS